MLTIEEALKVKKNPFALELASLNSSLQLAVKENLKKRARFNDCNKYKHRHE